MEGGSRKERGTLELGSRSLSIQLNTDLGENMMKILELTMPSTQAELVLARPGKVTVPFIQHGKLTIHGHWVEYTK